MRYKRHKKCVYTNGYVTLLSVLVVSAVTLSIGLSLLVSGIDASRIGFLFENSGQARFLADACAEEALQEIRDFTPFTGSGGLSFEYGDCTYTVVSGGGQSRTVTASSTVDTVVRKVTISITAINPLIVISSWEEVAD